jgi:hypothetical protein
MMIQPRKATMIQSRYVRVRTVLKAFVAGMLFAMTIGLWGVTAALAEPPGTFTNTGAMGTARSEHTATLLLSGEVLVTGDYDSGGNLAAAELYDPATGLFRATGAMTTARAGHTAILLRTPRRPGWKILVVGGWNNDSVLASAEVYDSATGRFSATGAMATARAGHTATLLPSGQVLITGGWNYSGNLAAAEVYDPATGRFSTTGVMTTVRAGHTATPLPSGQVLVTGGGESGEGGSYATAEAEVYAPATGLFSATGTMTMARSEHTATLLLSGQVLVTGGASTDGADIHAAAELYTQHDSLYAPAERRGLGVFAGL